MKGPDELYDRMTAVSDEPDDYQPDYREIRAKPAQKGKGDRGLESRLMRMGCSFEEGMERSAEYDWDVPGKQYR